MRAHFFAITQKNKIFYLLVIKELTNFQPKKIPPFSHETCMYVLNIEGHIKTLEYIKHVGFKPNKLTAKTNRKEF